MGKERHAVDSDDCSSDTEKADEVEEEPSEVDSEEEPDEEDPCEEEPDEEDPCEEEPSEEGSCEEEPDEDPYDESNIESLHGEEPNEVPCEEEPNRQASCEKVVIEGHSCESSREDETNEEPLEEDRHEEQYEIEQPEDYEPDEEEYEEEPSEEPSEEEPNEPGEPSGDDRYTSQSNPEKRNMSADAISGPKVSIGSFLETPQNMSKNVMAPEKLDNAKDSGRKRRSRWDVEAGSNGTADFSIDVAKKERKSRWSSDDSQLDSTAVVSDHDVVFYQEVVKLHAQLFEITQKLQAREVVDERPDGERSPSPPPLYNNLGMKINSREIRLRETLKLKRQMIISELIQKNPSYIPPPDYKSPNRSNSPTLTPIPKFCKKLYIPSKEYPEYNFAGLIIGPRGNTQKRMEKETGAKICLRGKGSVVEGKHKKPKTYDNDDDLHVLVEAGSKGSLDAAVAMVEKLLIPVEDWRNVHKLAQLQELATLNGTLRNKKLCDVCGDATHSTSACPLTASDPGANTNDHEVNYLSELRGAFSAFSAPALPSSYKHSVASTASVSSKPEKETDYTNLYVGHLPHSVDDNKLVELFSPFGQICESQVIRDKNTGLSRCYGFVKYVDHINATMAVTRMNGYKIDGQMLVVRAAGILLSPDKPKTGTGGFPSLHQLPQYPGYAAIAHSNPGPMCWPGPPGPVLREPGASFVKNEPSPVKPKTGTGGFPSLHQLPQYPGYAAIAHSNPGPMCWPGPSRPVLPEPGASFVKNDSNSVYRYPFHGQSSVSLGPFCQPPPPSTLLSRDVAASDEFANFPGYLKSLGPPSQLLQASQTTYLPSSQVHFTPNFSHPYMPPP